MTNLDEFPEARARCHKIADALLSALDAAGLVIVPREPSKAMVLASARAQWRYVSEMLTMADGNVDRDQWAAFLAASPFSVTEDPQP